MSAKIHTGFRLDTSNFIDIHNLLADWRAELDDLHKKRLALLHARLAVGIIDGLAVCPDEWAERFPDEQSRRWLTPYSFADTAVMERQERARRERRNDPAVDFEFELCLFPFEGRVYGMVFAGQRDWGERWMNKPGVEEYGYWSNADKPDEVSDEEWAERERIWGAILPGMAVPTLAGFTATCTRQDMFVDVDDVLAQMPDLAERVAPLAERLLIKAWAEAELARAAGQSPDWVQSAEGRAAWAAADGATLRRARAWLRSDEGMAALTLEKERVASLLKPKLTRKDLAADLAAAFPTVTPATPPPAP